MTRKQLQTELKALRATGRDVQVRLNAKTTVLQAEYNRVIGQPKVEKDDIDRMSRKELQERLRHLRNWKLVETKFSRSQKTDILRTKLRTVLSSEAYRVWLEQEPARQRKQEEFRQRVRDFQENYRQQEEERKRKYQERNRPWEEAEKRLEDYIRSLQTKTSFTPETAYEKALQRGYSKSEATSIKTIMESGSDRAKQAVKDRLMTA